MTLITCSVIEETEFGLRKRKKKEKLGKKRNQKPERNKREIIEESLVFTSKSDDGRWWIARWIVVAVEETIRNVTRRQNCPRAREYQKKKKKKKTKKRKKSIQHKKTVAPWNMCISDFNISDVSFRATASSFAARFFAEYSWDCRPCTMFRNDARFGRVWWWIKRRFLKGRDPNCELAFESYSNASKVIYRARVMRKYRVRTSGERLLSNSIDESLENRHFQRLFKS